MCHGYVSDSRPAFNGTGCRIPPGRPIVWFVVGIVSTYPSGILGYVLARSFDVAVDKHLGVRSVRSTCLGAT